MRDGLCGRGQATPERVGAAQVPHWGLKEEGQRGCLEGQKPPREQLTPEGPLWGFQGMIVPQYPHTLSWPKGSGEESLRVRPTKDHPG